MEVFVGIIGTLAVLWALCVLWGAKKARQDIGKNAATVRLAHFINMHHRMPTDREKVEMCVEALHYSKSVRFFDLHDEDTRLKLAADVATIIIQRFTGVAK